MLGRLRGRIDELVERDLGGFGPPVFGLHHDRALFLGLKLGAAAEYLGLTKAQLRDRLEEGQSLADVARAEAKSVDGLKQALVAAARERLDEAVEEGDVTRERANEMLERLREGVDDLVERDLEDSGPRRFGPPAGGLIVPRGNA